MNRKDRFAFPGELKLKGVLGMNRRNLDLLAAFNPRKCYPVVDNKLETKKFCLEKGIPVPETYCVVSRYGDIRKVFDFLEPLGKFVVKPSSGSEGNGILLITGSDESVFFTAKGDRIERAQLKYHLASILSGLYSLGGLPDTAFAEQYIQLHPVFSDHVSCGIPDIRILVFKNRPVMAMLRLPTYESKGRANLFQGGIGAGIEMETGSVFGPIQYNRKISVHPDTGKPIEGFIIPFWNRLLEIAGDFSTDSGLGFIGVDLVIDAEKGPLLLEANARPGLSIQLANNKGLLSILKQ